MCVCVCSVLCSCVKLVFLLTLTAAELTGVRFLTWEEESAVFPLSSAFWVYRRVQRRESAVVRLCTLNLYSCRLCPGFELRWRGIKERKSVYYSSCISARCGRIVGLAKFRKGKSSDVSPSRVTTFYDTQNQHGTHISENVNQCEAIKH